MSTLSAGFTEGDDFRYVYEVGGGIFAGGGDDLIVIVDKDYTLFVEGEAGQDTIIGGVGRNQISGGIGADHLIGNEDNDRLAGDGDGDLIEGLGGDDRLYGGDAATLVGLNGVDSNEFDYIAGTSMWTPSGDDTLFGGGGLDEIFGYDGSDELHGGDDADRLDGGAGSDTLSGDQGDDVLYGGGGNDLMFGGTDGHSPPNDGEDTLFGGAGNDTMSGGEGADSLEGRDDDDVLYGGKGRDELEGNDGNDVLIGGDGIDTLDGGFGDDTLHGDRFDLFFGTSRFPFLAFRGDSGHDVLTFELTDVGLTLNMEDFFDIEHFIGTQADDVITPHHMSVDAHDGDDRIVATQAGQNFNGGAGVDLVTYRLSTSAVTVALDAPALGWAANGRGGAADGDQISYVEGLHGSDHDDRLYGDGGANSFRGLQGDDIIHGGEGADTLLGNTGNDLLQGGAGSDFLDGGAGNDTATYRDSKVGVYVHLSSPTQGGHGLRGDAHFDKLESIENLTGSYHGDHLRGDNADNRLEGLFGADTLDGFAGDDTLVGAQGDDTLTGGEGADAFVFYTGSHTGEDVITDYEEGVDRIEIFGKKAEAEIIYEDWGVMVIIEGPEVFSLTIKGAWELDLTFMG